MQPTFLTLVPWTPFTTFFWTFLAFCTAATGAASLPASPFFSPSELFAFQSSGINTLSMPESTCDLLGCWLFAILGDLRGHIGFCNVKYHYIECIINSFATPSILQKN